MQLKPGANDVNLTIELTYNVKIHLEQYLIQYFPGLVMDSVHSHVPGGLIVKIWVC